MLSVLLHCLRTRNAMASTGHSVTRYSACARMHARDQRWRQGALPPPPMGRYCGYAEIASLQPRARALFRVSAGTRAVRISLGAIGNTVYF
jgi:hypothetical protein